MCNIFYPTTDCQAVSGGVDIYLNVGESKIYVPKGSLAVMTSVDFNVDPQELTDAFEFL